MQRDEAKLLSGLSVVTPSGYETLPRLFPPQYDEMNGVFPTNLSLDQMTYCFWKILEKFRELSKSKG